MAHAWDTSFYLLGYKDRSAVLAAEHASKIVPGNNGMFLSTMVVAGHVVGTWKRRFKKNALEILLHPFTHLGAEDVRVMKAARRYSDFLEGKGRVRVEMALLW